MHLVKTVDLFKHTINQKLLQFSRHSCVLFWRRVQIFSMLCIRIVTSQL